MTKSFCAIERAPAPPEKNSLLTALGALGSVIRLGLWVIGAVLEPLVTRVLKALALMAALTAGFFYSTLPPDTSAPLGKLLILAAGCLLTAWLWSRITTLLAPSEKC